MARTEEAEAFFHAVYTAVQEIPVGKVTTYGHIARLVGTRESFPHSTPPLTLPPITRNLISSHLILHMIPRTIYVIHKEHLSGNS